MDPLIWARQIVCEHPEVAEDLYKLLVWATTNREDPAHEAQLDQVEEVIYAKTQDSIRHRGSFRDELAALFADGETPTLIDS